MVERVNYGSNHDELVSGNQSGGSGASAGGAAAVVRTSPVSDFESIYSTRRSP